MEEVGKKALNSFLGTTPTHCFKYVGDTWLKIKIQKLQAFTDHINVVHPNIKFIREDTKDNRLPFLGCAVIIGSNGSLGIEIYRKPTCTYMQFDSHHPLQHKLGVIRTLNHRERNIPTSTEANKKEDGHLKTALKPCGYPTWTFNKAMSWPSRTMEQSETQSRWKNLVIPYIAGVSEKLKMIFGKHHIPVHFKPTNTLRQRPIHPNDRTPKHNRSNTVYAV